MSKNNKHMNFKTLYNNGCAENYINTCLWICIQQYIAYVLGIENSIKELRKEADFDEESYCQDFNFFNSDHNSGLKKMLDKYNLGIRFYYANEKDNVISLSSYNEEINETKENIIPIVNFCSNNHFELITSGTEHVKSIEEIVNEKNLLFFNSGKFIDLNKLSEDEISFLEEIINDFCKTKNYIDSIKFKIEKIKFKLFKMKNFFDMKFDDYKKIHEQMKEISAFVSNEINDSICEYYKNVFNMKQNEKIMMKKKLDNLLDNIKKNKLQKEKLIDDVNDLNLQLNDYEKMILEKLGRD